MRGVLPCRMRWCPFDRSPGYRRTIPGGTYEQLFYVADIDAEGPALDGELHIDLDEADFLAVFPLQGEGGRG